jgi:hypothetical protein
VEEPDRPLSGQANINARVSETGALPTGQLRPIGLAYRILRRKYAMLILVRLLGKTLADIHARKLHFGTATPFPNSEY